MKIQAVDIAANQLGRLFVLTSGTLAYVMLQPEPFEWG